MMIDSVVSRLRLDFTSGQLYCTESRNFHEKLSSLMAPPTKFISYQAGVSRMDSRFFPQAEEGPEM